MAGKNYPAQNQYTAPLTRAGRSLLKFFERTLTPVNRPLAPECRVPELPEDDLVLKRREQSFSRELFAELLVELPAHRRRIANTSDVHTLRGCVHQLLGAVTYCDAPELEQALRELRLALKTGNQDTIGVYHDRAINVIDSTLRYSGYRGHV